MNGPKVVPLREDDAGKIVDEIPSVETGGNPPHPPGMDDAWRSSVDTRLGELKGALDGLRLSFSILAGAVGLVAAVMAIGIGIANNQFSRLDGRIDQLGDKMEAIPQRLSEEFRAMRAEMAAQTSAIANSITATKQQAPPQVIVVPLPTQSPQTPPQQSPPSAPR
jgi:hypothetical protein